MNSAKRAPKLMTSRFKILGIASLCLGLALAGCGRKSALDTPGVVSPAEETAIDPVVTAEAEAIGTSSSASAAEKPGKGFFLNPLIGLE